MVIKDYFMNTLKSAIKPMIPNSILTLYQKWVRQNFEKKIHEKSAEEIFSLIYKSYRWGGSDLKAEKKYYSGSGSHRDIYTKPYVEKITAYLKKLEQKPDVADLGCGDFVIGSQIRPYCANYIAGDIVDHLIEYNKSHYSNLDVDFRVINMAESELPKADIVFVRQVFQHLSNEMIQKCLANLIHNYPVLILTEQIPLSDNFPPNKPMDTGSNIRTGNGSGVVITEAPFNIKVKKAEVICNIELDTTRVITTAYTFA